MDRLFWLSGSTRPNPSVLAWFEDGDAVLRGIARLAFERIEACGPDVTSLLHDNAPTCCTGGAAFAYVNAYRAHAAIGFFHGADLPDPAGRLEGSGKRMRHVKLRPGEGLDSVLDALIDAAYRDIRRRLDDPASSAGRGR